FQQFPVLPSEIRLQIWEQALPGPRVVPRTWNNDKYHYSLRRRVPLILQVCREARYLGLSMYHLVRQFEKKDGAVYLNWAKDEVYIRRGCKYMVTKFEFMQLQRLRFLRMHWGLRPCWCQTTLYEGVGFLRQFPALEVITIMTAFAESTASATSQEYADKLATSRKFSVKLKSRTLRSIASMILTQFRLEIVRDPAWRPPRLRVVRLEVWW
ncbi:hypothetical protein QBC46DRAFT_274702, partial [Diplogelasinospora grovesii]